MLTTGNATPTTRMISVGSPLTSLFKTDLSAPTTVRLDGNFGRRRYLPAESDRNFSDADLPGFGLRVRKGGGIGTWFVMLHRRGRRFRLTLGKADRTSAADARTAARKALAAATLDGLPVPPPKPNRITLDAFADEFMRDYGPRWKPATRKTSADILRRELLPAFGRHAVAEIARTDVNRWRDSLAGPREAIFNRAIPVLSVMLQYAEKLGYFRKGSNPCRGIPCSTFLEC